MKLYGILGSPRTNKILAAAELLGIHIELVPVSPLALESEDHLKKNPNGRSPVLETKSGFLYESNAILRFLARSKPEK